MHWNPHALVPVWASVLLGVFDHRLPPGRSRRLGLLGPEA